MEEFVGLAERFGLPVVMLLGMSYGMVQLFKWLATDLMRQLQDNAKRIEAIVIKLIDNSKNQEANMEKVMTNFIEDSKTRDKQMGTLIDLITKILGNGFKK